ncbi:hypothetical protein LVJ94_07890 [Pendulispora rubella]|uniref:Uncharacterized protein n=1 Tax=Pendulispora rubella TaxID=2741070 RepID=A0ABZ2LDB3_9BACT
MTSLDRGTSVPACMQVPDWLVGTNAAVTRSVAATARKWAREYFLSGQLPELQLVDPAGLPLLVFSSSDLRPTQRAARLFAVVNFQIRADDVLGPGRHRDFLDAFESHTGQSAWGTFDNVMSGRWPSTFDVVRRRLEQVQPQLETLASTMVVDVGYQARPASVVLESTLNETLTYWDAGEGSPLPERVATALKRMDASSPEEVRERVVSCIMTAAQAIRRVQNREWFTPDRVRDYLTTLGTDAYDALTGCMGNEVASEVYAIDRGVADGEG